VLIAGGGPVGLALAIELGLRGVRCLLVEKRDGAVPVPKMSQVSSRNMEFCRRWGIAEKVQNAVWSPDHPLDFVYLTSLTGSELARQKVPSYAARGDMPLTPVGPCHCPQNYFDPLLVAKAKTLPAVTLRYRTGLAALNQNADRVTAQLVDTLTGKEETVTARYLVGCDGPGGVVRETLGIPLGGVGALANSINLYFRSPDLAALHDKGWARFYRLIDETGCWGELIAIDGYELWRLTVFDDRAATVDAHSYLRRAAGREFPYEMISVMRWERRDYVAEHYGEGSVFIAGDAAHQCSPTGGLGMHTGIEEAVNLGWKLAAMVEGWGGPRLLASYETERRPIARRNVDFATRAFRETFAIAGSFAIAEANRRRPVDALQSQVRRFSLHEHLKSQYCYEASPVCVDDGTPPPLPEPDVYVPCARPGGRAPHVWIDGKRSTLDLFGDGFVLLCLGPDAPDPAPLISAATARGMPLRVERLDGPGLLLEAYARRLVLVRPDGHVAWRADTPPANAHAVIDRVRGAM